MQGIQGLQGVPGYSRKPKGLLTPELRNPKSFFSSSPTGSKTRLAFI